MDKFQPNDRVYRLKFFGDGGLAGVQGANALVLHKHKTFEHVYVIKEIESGDEYAISEDLIVKDNTHVSEETTLGLAKAGDPSIQLFTGAYMNVLDPNPDAINLRDIAHSLSLQCRYTGHVTQFWSVAQHSLLVSAVCQETLSETSVDKQQRASIYGLLHDATEAYLCDLPRPIKQLTDLGGAYARIERRLASAVAKRFGLPEAFADLPYVKLADTLVLGLESKHLMRNHEWSQRIQAHPEYQSIISHREWYFQYLLGLSILKVEEMFLSYASLMGVA